MQIRLSQHRPLGHRWRSPLTLALIVALLLATTTIWPSARLAVSAYEGSGVVTLLAFMGFVFVLATVLGVTAAKVLSEEET